MAKLDVNGTSFEYADKGTGEPVVFIHGSASDWRTWQHQLSYISKQYRAIAYSRRYHWPNASIREGADYAMEEHVSDLQALLHSLHATPAHLVGHSYGAFLALLLAVMEPQLVRTLSFVAIATFPLAQDGVEIVLGQISGSTVGLSE